MDNYGQGMRQDNFAGEHVDGKRREAEEESRKNKFFGMFSRGHEGFRENHSDRNKEGRRDKQSGYE